MVLCFLTKCVLCRSVIPRVNLMPHIQSVWCTLDLVYRILLQDGLISLAFLANESVTYLICATIKLCLPQPVLAQLRSYWFVFIFAKYKPHVDLLFCLIRFGPCYLNLYPDCESRSRTDPYQPLVPSGMIGSNVTSKAMVQHNLGSVPVL